MRRGSLLTLTLIMMLAAVLSACGGNSDNNSTATGASPTGGNASDTAANTAQNTAENTPAESGSGKIDPPITLTTVRQVLPTVKYAEGDSVDNNPWTRAYAERFGVNIKTLWAVDASQWEQKTNLMIASGDIPDFFQATPVQFRQLVDASLLEDLTDAYGKAPDHVKQVLSEGGEQAIKSATIDGKLMAIPFTGAPKEGSQMIWIRTDWLRNLGLSEPKTMDDILKISEAFTKQDPDKNGKDDTFGLAVDKAFNLLTGFFNGFHAYYSIWTKDASGKLQYSSIQPEMKNALQALQNMFKSKQIDPEFGAKDFPKVAEAIVGGKIGMMYGSPYSGLYPLQTGIDQDPKAEWKAFPIVSADAEPAKNQTALGVVGYWVVKKGVEHPEALFNMIDFWIQMFYENKDEALNTKYVNDGNVEIWQMNNIAVYKAFKNVDQRIKVVEALKTKDTSNLTGDDKGVYDKITKFQAGDRSLWGWNAIFGSEGSMKVSDEYRKNDQYVSDEFISSPLPIMAERNTDLGKLQEETFTKIIMGKASIDEFDKFVADWKKRGGDEITAAVNQWYTSNK